MKPGLQEKLYEAYPKIFAQRKSSMSETCMCWGIETPDSWYHIIDALCLSIQNYLDENYILPQVEAVQVKEKFGTLRFYISGGDEIIDGFINAAEEESSKICAGCGSYTDVKPTKGWITYLCPTCTKKEKK